MGCSPPVLSSTPSATGPSPQRPQKMDGEVGRLFPSSLGLPPGPQPAASSLPSPLQVGTGLGRVGQDSHGHWKEQGSNNCLSSPSPAGPALPAPSSMPQAALAVRCVAPRGPALGIPLPQLPPSSHQRYQRWLRQGRWHGRTYRNDPAPPPQVTRGEWPFPHRRDVSRSPPNSGDLY